MEEQSAKEILNENKKEKMPDNQEELSPEACKLVKLIVVTNCRGLYHRINNFILQAKAACSDTNNCNE